MKRNPIKTPAGNFPHIIVRKISSFAPMVATVVVIGLGATIASGHDDGYDDEGGAEVLSEAPEQRTQVTITDRKQTL